ncbi:hypothetical protein L1887_08775 [Cichorium endivia]|nr:hypothetical protein L1887_08775 [Cichorium endivia]
MFYSSVALRWDMAQQMVSAVHDWSTVKTHVSMLAMSDTVGPGIFVANPEQSTKGIIPSAYANMLPPPASETIEWASQ